MRLLRWEDFCMVKERKKGISVGRSHPFLTVFVKGEACH